MERQSLTGEAAGVTEQALLDRRLALLEREMDRLDAGIRRSDEYLFRVKGWAIAAASAATALAITSGQRHVLFVGVLSSFGFWLLDAYTKSVQRYLIRRSRQIDAFLQGPGLAQALRTGNLDHFQAPRLNQAMMLDVSTRGSRFRAVVREAARFQSYFLYLALALVLLLAYAIGVPASATQAPSDSPSATATARVD